MKTYTCIDAHTCGNPVRVVTSGTPLLKGRNMFEKRQHFLEHYDWIRKGLMFEPRGHDMMSGSMLYPPMEDENDIAVLFIETSGCLPMCGHGLIGTVTVAIEHGLVFPKEKGKLRVETPAGLVQVDYQMDQEKVTSVKITNVPSFLIRSDLKIDSAELGTLTFDIAYGGNFYAIVDIQENFKGMDAYSAADLIAMSRDLRKRINENYEIVHPENSNIKSVTHILWTGHPIDKKATARNAVFYGEKAIDRSPCGTGTSARMAQWYNKGKLKKGDTFIHESIIGSQFRGVVEEETTVGAYPAIIPSIEGWARIIGINTIFVEEDCPYKEGFQVI